MRFSLIFCFSQLNNRKEICENKSTFSRNEYILALAATNAHSSQYYSQDLPELMKVAFCALCLIKFCVHHPSLIWFPGSRWHIVWQHSWFLHYSFYDRAWVLWSYSRVFHQNSDRFYKGSMSLLANNFVLLSTRLQISRQYSNQCFLHDNLVLTDLVQYQFEPQDNDPVSVSHIKDALVG
jgi:hypothetical protein